jgi:hypothetical protein
LDEAAGFRLDGAPRRRLAELKLITSDPVGPRRSYIHELTDAGWRWCADELSAPRPDRAGSLGNALYLLLRGIRDHLDRTDQTLADIFGTPAAPPPAADVEGRVRAAYSALATAPSDWVSLTDVRARLSDLPRDAVDGALIRLERDPSVYIAPDEDQKALTDADRAAAIRIGGKDKHLLAIAD